MRLPGQVQGARIIHRPSATRAARQMAPAMDRVILTLRATRVVAQDEALPTQSESTRSPRISVRRATTSPTPRWTPNSSRHHGRSDPHASTDSRSSSQPHNSTRTRRDTGRRVRTVRSRRTDTTIPLSAHERHAMRLGASRAPVGHPKIMATCRLLTPRNHLIDTNCW